MELNVKIISNKQRRGFEKETRMSYVPNIIFSLSSVYVVPRNKSCCVVVVFVGVCLLFWFCVVYLGGERNTKLIS